MEKGVTQRKQTNLSLCFFFFSCLSFMHSLLHFCEWIKQQKNNNNRNVLSVLCQKAIYSKFIYDNSSTVVHSLEYCAYCMCFLLYFHPLLFLWGCIDTHKHPHTNIALTVVVFVHFLECQLRSERSTRVQFKCGMVNSQHLSTHIVIYAKMQWWCQKRFSPFSIHIHKRRVFVSLYRKNIQNMFLLLLLVIQLAPMQIV